MQQGTNGRWRLWINISNGERRKQGKGEKAKRVNGEKEDGLEVISVFSVLILFPFDPFRLFPLVVSRLAKQIRLCWTNEFLAVPFSRNEVVASDNHCRNPSSFFHEQACRSGKFIGNCDHGVMQLASA
jgi:hypothetical protein